MAKKRIFIFIFPAYLMIIILSIAAIIWLFTRVMYKSYSDMVKEKLQSSAFSLLPLIEDKLRSGEGEQFNRILQDISEKTQLRITIIDPEGVVLAESSRNVADMENHSNRPEIQSAINGVPAFSTRYSATLTKDTMYLAVPIRDNGKPVAVLRISVTLNSMDRALRSTYFNIITFGVLVAVIAIGIAYFISRKLSQPLEKLKNNASRLAEGNFVFKPLRSNIKEIDELSSSMNSMSDSLQERIKEISEQQNELRLILGNMREGVIAIDLNDNIISFNAAAKQILNTSNASMLSITEDSSSEDVFVENVGKEDGHELHSFKETVRIEALHKFVGDLLRERKFLQCKIELVGLQSKIIDVHGAVLNDQLGQPVGVLLVINDITQISQLENMRKNFAANVSHELKTPLTAIKGAVETLQEGAMDSPQDAEKFLNIIAKHSDRLTALINDTMSLSRIEQEAEQQSMQKEKIKLIEAVTTAIDICREKAESKKVSFKIDCPDKIELEVNGQMLEQAMVNLIDNAVKFSPENDIVAVSASASAKFVTIRVVDHGCGIPAKHIPHLFERFYRVDKGRSRQNGGTGLGLAIVKHIAQSHEGTVGVESIPGKETTFSIKLPI